MFRKKIKIRDKIKEIAKNLDKFDLQISKGIVLSWKECIEIEFEIYAQHYDVRCGQVKDMKKSRMLLLVDSITIVLDLKEEEFLRNAVDREIDRRRKEAEEEIFKIIDFNK